MVATCVYWVVAGDWGCKFLVQLFKQSHMAYDYYIGQHITKWPLRSLSIPILYNFINVPNAHNTHELIQMLPKWKYVSNTHKTSDFQ